MQIKVNITTANGELLERFTVEDGLDDVSQAKLVRDAIEHRFNVLDEG